MSRRRKHVPFDQRFGEWPEHYGRECDATYQLDRIVEEAKREMGPEKWARLNAEWNEPCRELSGKREN